MRLFWIFVILSFQGSLSFAVEAKWNVAARKMVNAGFNKKFILELKKQYEPEGFNQTVELNTLLYLKKNDIHGIQVSTGAEQKVRKFLLENESSFQRAEKDFGVSRNVIASLLWIESRHGQNLGKFHVPSVYVHLLQSDDPKVQAHLISKAKSYKKNLTKKDFAEIKKRSRKKAEWALVELKALQKIHAKDKKVLKDLRGSFSGAFGLAQFIPSSFLQYARSPVKGRTPNLTNPSDAIYSVGNYLRIHKWSSTKKKAQVSALMKYNNSQDYAKAILRLADKAKPSKIRMAN